MSTVELGRRALARVREGTEILRTGGGVRLQPSDCHNLLNYVEALEAERDHYRDHSPAGGISFERCEASACEDAREALGARPE